MSSPESQLEEELIRTLCDLTYEYRADIRDRNALDKNFRAKFQALNHVNRLRINTDNSHHRYDVLLLINRVLCAKLELKTLGINPRRATEQIAEYNNDLYSSSLPVERKFCS